ncbi:MAG: hypothetical protein HQ556_09715 [Candidatus Marinimicrobia bacterium]|nr:hypothetical protein [Candidatus Neomarinimicrobiota bacterium]
MAKPNYAFAKHQRDLAKKKKKEEKKKLKEEAKLQQKLDGESPETNEEDSSEEPSDS